MKVPTCARSLHSNRSCLETSWNSILTCKCKYSVYLPSRPRRGLPTLQDLKLHSLCLHLGLGITAVPSQSTGKDAISSRRKIRRPQIVFPNNYQANKLTKESGTLTSGLLGRCITNSKGYHKGGTACPTDLRSTKLVFAQKTGGSW